MSESIKIKCTDYDLNRGTTDVGNIDTLFHALVSVRLNDVEIDPEFLEKLEDIYENVSLWTRLSVAAVGSLIAKLGAQSGGSCYDADVGYLLVGLAELQMQLDVGFFELDKARKAINKANMAKGEK